MSSLNTSSSKGPALETAALMTAMPTTVSITYTEANPTKRAANNLWLGTYARAVHSVFVLYLIEQGIKGFVG